MYNVHNNPHNHKVNRNLNLPQCRSAKRRQRTPAQQQQGLEHGTLSAPLETDRQSAASACPLGLAVKSEIRKESATWEQGSNINLAVNF